MVTYEWGVDDDRVFKALADPVRRALLDRLFRQGGLTLGELCEGLEMTRFGVMKHLRVLEEAHLVLARKEGREKLHDLNAAPIRRIHDRWIGKYAAQITAAMSGLKDMLEAEEAPPADRGVRRAKKEKGR